MRYLRILSVVVLSSGLLLGACSNGNQASKTEAPAPAPEALMLEQKVPNEKPTCTDIMPTLTVKSAESSQQQTLRIPVGLKFNGCSDGNSAQIRTLEYNYVVAGSAAKATERFLIDNFGMAPLGFVCCGWEPRPIDAASARLGTYRNDQGHHYDIAMGSGETLEKDWNKIPQFTVTVELFLDIV